MRLSPPLFVVLTLISIANRKAEGWNDASGGCCRGTAATSRAQARVAIDGHVCTQCAEGQPPNNAKDVNSVLVASRKIGLKFLV